MEELKPCLLPCNLEQLNDRINNLGVGIAQMGEQDTIRVHKAFLVSVLGYMEELLGMRQEEENRRAAPENKLQCGGCENQKRDGFNYEVCVHCKRHWPDRYARKPEGSEP